MNPETEKWLAEVRARLEKATPEPWSKCPGGHSIDAECEVEPGTKHVYPCATQTDYDFIAYSREDVPRLLALVTSNQLQSVKPKGD